MTDSKDSPERTPESPPDDFPEIQALLRASRAEEPMPGHVADRLDDVIAGLAADRAAGTSVVPLRRRVPRAAAAAAAVVLLAGGVAAVAGALHHPGGAGSSGTAARAVPSTADSATPGASGTAPEQKSLQGLTDVAGTPALSSAHLRADVLRLLGPTDSLRAGPSYSARSPQPVTGCRGPAHVAAGSYRHVVLLDGTPGLLVVRREGGRFTRARVWSCDGGHLLAGTALRNSP